MATKRRPSVITRGATASKGGVLVGSDVWIFQGSSAPVDGTSGTGVGFAGIGSLYIYTTTGALYQNTGTKASPTWTAR